MWAPSLTQCFPNPQLPVDMSVTNYSWKNKNKAGGEHALSGPLPSHIGQSIVEDEKKPLDKPKSPTSPHSQLTDEEEDEEEGSDVAEHHSKHKKKGPPEAVRRIGYVMKYR